MKTRLATLTAIALSSSAALAAITVDGTLDLDYGPAIAVQSVQTQFGDANPPGNLGGSELDAAYAKISNGRLYLMFTGNQEPNFNKLVVFFDSKPGGENVLSNIPEYDANNVSQNLGGMTFDAGFSADYHLFSRWGSGNGPYHADFVDRQGGADVGVPGTTGSSGAAVGLIASGSLLAGASGPGYSGSALSQNLEFAINDNNAAGVIGGTGAANAVAALAVTTGMEFSISLADLGNPTPGSSILIAAMIGNGDNNYLSNQVLAGLASGTSNLGGDGNGGFTGTLSGVNFNQFAGNQYFTVLVPEPSSLTLFAIGSLVVLTRTRRASNLR